MLCLCVRFGENIVQRLAHCYRLAFVADAVLGRICQPEHLLCPEPELRTLDRCAFGILENRKNVVVPLLRDEGLVTLLGRERRDVLVEELVELLAAGKLFRGLPSIV